MGFIDDFLNEENQASVSQFNVTPDVESPSMITDFLKESDTNIGVQPEPETPSTTSFISDFLSEEEYQSPVQQQMPEDTGVIREPTFFEKLTSKFPKISETLFKTKQAAPELREEDIKEAPGELLKGVARGGLKALSSVGNIIQWAFEQEDDPQFDVTEKDNIATRIVDKFNKGVVALGKDVTEFWNEQAEKMTTEELAKSSWTERPFSKAAATVGEGLPLYGVAIASNIVTKNPLFAGAIFGASEGSESYVKAREAGKDPQESNIIALLNGAWTTVSEAIPFDEMLGDAGKKAITRMAKGAFNEGLQELVQTVGTNVIEKLGFDEGRNIMDGWIEAIVGGTVLGAGGGAVTKTQPKALIKEEVKKPDDKIPEEPKKPEPLKMTEDIQKKLDYPSTVTLDEYVEAVRASQEGKETKTSIQSIISDHTDAVVKEIETGREVDQEVIKSNLELKEYVKPEVKVEKKQTPEQISREALKQEAKKYKSEAEYLLLITSGEDRYKRRKGLELINPKQPIESLKPNPKNPKTSSEVVKNWEEIISNGKRPVIITDSNNMIIDGHHKYEAYKNLGINKVPTVTKQQLTDIYNEAQKEVQTIKEKPKKIRRQEEFKPVGTGKVKKSGYVNKISKFLGDLTTEEASMLPEYQTMNNKEQIESAVDYVVNNPQDAIDVVRGKKRPPKGLLYNSISLALEEYASDAKDVNLLRQIASLRSTRFGQEIEILKEAKKDSPVKYITELQKRRNEAFGDEKQLKKQKVVETKKLQKTIQQSKPTKGDWAAFIKSIEC